MQSLYDHTQFISITTKYSQCCLHTHKHTPTITASPQGIHALFSGEQAQLVTSKSSWMEGRMLYQLPPGSPSIPRPYKSRYTCTQQIRHQHRQARGGRRTTGSEHQHRQARDEPTARPACPLPGGPDFRGVNIIPNGTANQSRS